MKEKLLLCLVALLLPITLCYSNPSSTEDGYSVPTDKDVLEKLDNWQDLKFGVIFHWGLYSVPGIIESWALCGEDKKWIYEERVKRGMTLEQFRQWYWALDKEFNPCSFDPEKWADIMKDAGMKYCLFTTKHHDGYCMFDTKTTDYKVTAGPFGGNPKSNVTKEVLNAFRGKDFMVGAYFSKIDWHCPYYWSPLFDAPTRRFNYDRKEHPEIFEKFVDFTTVQLEELTTDYGNIDIIWIDGGCFKGTEIGLDKILSKARTRNPGMICVDRSAGGQEENYMTPEGKIPEKQLNIPWETCEALGHWSWQPDARFKSKNTVIARLIEIVAKGGNYLLGIGPTPEGTIDDQSQKILADVGVWMRKYGKAIYNTRTTKAYNRGRVWFNADKNDKTLYALYAYKDGDGVLPEKLQWAGNIPSGKMTLVSTGQTVKYKVSDNIVTVTLPKGLPAESFALEFVKK
ncbi:MAG: alpha-L-fucosidase [Bacteroidales bacterium]|nr:alpha-L-fucosidase [Bacteroidales bacterium]